MKKNTPYVVLWLVLIAVDQVSKFVIVKALGPLQSITVIPGFFEITHVRNPGAIFGSFSHTDNLMVMALLRLASLLAVGLIVYYFLKTPAQDKLMKISLTLILVGALGNFIDRFIYGAGGPIDRLLRGAVIDFLDFFIGKAHWPTFNVADSCITIGACLMLVSLFRRKPECSPSS
jgi:signal peptidase II